MATGGAMHNYYMFHGGNHYGNWRRAAGESRCGREGGGGSSVRGGDAQRLPDLPQRLGRLALHRKSSMREPA
jgi:hypothetical protein